MNTDIRRLVFGATEYSAFRHGTHVPVPLARRPCCSAASESAMKAALGVEKHACRAHAKRHEVPS